MIFQLQQPIGRRWTTNDFKRAQAVNLNGNYRRCENEISGWKCRSVLQDKDRHRLCHKCRGVKPAKKYSDEIKNFCIQQVNGGLTCADVARQTDIPWSTVKAWHKEAAG